MDHNMAYELHTISTWILSVYPVLTKPVLKLYGMHKPWREKK